MVLDIYRQTPAGLQLVGAASEDEQARFHYDPAYLASRDARPLSLSLPLQGDPFAEGQAAPFLRGLLPEGQQLSALAQELGADEADYLTILGRCGLDCVGDIVIDPHAYEGERGYLPISLDELRAASLSSAAPARALGVSRLSLAGTQGKCGLYHDPACPAGEGWYRPLGGAPSNVIFKFPSQLIPRIAVVECVCMGCAGQLGVEAARTHLLDLGGYAIAIERFDRLESSGELIAGLPVPLRRHQEDLAQAFGLLPGSKYAEFQGDSLAAIAKLLRLRSARPAADIAQLARIALFNYLIGNCDNHLKNLSILYSEDWNTFALAPAYDIVSTTLFERFSRDMGMALGGERCIDKIDAARLEAVARSLGVSKRLLKGVAGELAEGCVPALRAVGQQLGDEGAELAPYVADDLEEDIAPRLEVLRAFAR